MFPFDDVIMIHLYTSNIPSILGKIDWLVASPRPKSVWRIISLSTILAQMSCGILLSSIAPLDLLFIIFSCKIAEYAYIWLRLLNS